MDCGHATTRRSGWTANRSKRQRHTLALGRQTELLPRLHAAGEMAIVGQACALRDQRRGDGAIARTAGKDDLPALRIGDRGRVELRHRKIEGVGITLDLGLARLPGLPPEGFSRRAPRRGSVCCPPAAPPPPLWRGCFLCVLPRKGGRPPPPPLPRGGGPPK